MKNKNPLNTEGFTLVEILIAVFIFAVILTTIFTTYTGAFRIMEQTESQAGIYAMARTALERMIEDLESIYVIPRTTTNKTDGDTRLPDLFVGEEKEIGGRPFASLRFLSTAHISFQGGAQVSAATRIAYYVVQSEGENGASLFRSDTPELEEGPEEGSGGVPLCEGLSAVDFTYYGADGTPHKNWDSADLASDAKLPVMVFISLEFLNKADPDSPIRFRTGVSLPMGREIYGKTPQR
ncbi:MAG: prepilin-type N-terminal cleavage/methylation domain-containing protein [Pseudomonadota bacterium]